MDKFQEKYGKFVQAVNRLEEALQDYDIVKLNSVRDGVIQRFEFCTDLAWKITREYLLDQGYVNINSPKAVMKQAFADGLLDDEIGWLELINTRNLTPYIYDEATTKEIFENIRNVYYLLFRKLIEKLK